ncbi:hypothetical protein JYJ95_29065 [Corallococcus exiguus]|uniref:hypothetical protein n=1 Tax=Corallococcus exiguus TaxID=83462 RepID=UPI001A8C2F85|nr:hypothetical protein [Corallococcus exiguus]MBN8470578.1 hypothetical protein [Corallococcus exiguus]
MTRSGAVWLWLLLPVAAWAEDIPEPTLILDGGSEFGLINLGAPVRQRAWGGTLLFPTSEGTPRPGAFAWVGLGVDHAR